MGEYGEQDFRNKDLIISWSMMESQKNLMEKTTVTIYIRMIRFYNSFDLGMEFCGPKYRLLGGIIAEVSWGLGFALLIGIAWCIRDELYLQLAISLPSLLYIAYYW